MRTENETTTPVQETAVALAIVEVRRFVQRHLSEKWIEFCLDRMMDSIAEERAMTEARGLVFSLAHPRTFRAPVSPETMFERVLEAIAGAQIGFLMLRSYHPLVREALLRLRSSAPTWAAQALGWREGWQSAISPASTQEELRTRLGCSEDHMLPLLMLQRCCTASDAMEVMVWALTQVGTKGPRDYDRSPLEPSPNNGPSFLEPLFPTSPHQFDPLLRPDALWSGAEGALASAGCKPTDKICRSDNELRERYLTAEPHARACFLAAGMDPAWTDKVLNELRCRGLVHTGQAMGWDGREPEDGLTSESLGRDPQKVRENNLFMRLEASKGTRRHAAMERALDLAPCSADAVHLMLQALDYDVAVGLDVFDSEAHEDRIPSGHLSVYPEPRPWHERGSWYGSEGPLRSPRQMKERLNRVGALAQRAFLSFGLDKARIDTLLGRVFRRDPWVVGCELGWDGSEPQDGFASKSLSDDEHTARCHVLAVRMGLTDRLLYLTQSGIFENMGLEWWDNGPAIVQVMLAALDQEILASSSPPPPEGSGRDPEAKEAHPVPAPRKVLTPEQQITRDARGHAQGMLAMLGVEAGADAIGSAIEGSPGVAAEILRVLAESRWTTSFTRLVKRLELSPSSALELHRVLWDRAETDSSFTPLNVVQMMLYALDKTTKEAPPASLLKRDIHPPMGTSRCGKVATEKENDHV